MVAEYLLLTSFIYYNVMFQLLYIFLSYVILKVLYGEKAQITDIFLMGVASIVLILVSMIAYLSIYFTVRIYFVALILNRVLLFAFLFKFKNKINDLYKSFYKLWNRHDNPKQIKSLTIRNFSVVAFNFMLVFTNNVWYHNLYYCAEV